MLLHRDGLIELNYNAADDILTVLWSDLSSSSDFEINFSFEKLITLLKHYDIKKLLIYNNTNVADVPDEEYIGYVEAIFQLGHALLTTRLEKIARLQSGNPARESKVEEATAAVIRQLHVPIAYKNFPDEASALNWLCE